MEDQCFDPARHAEPTPCANQTTKAGTLTVRNGRTLPDVTERSAGDSAILTIFGLNGQANANRGLSPNAVRTDAIASCAGQTRMH